MYNDVIAFMIIINIIINIMYIYIARAMYNYITTILYVEYNDVYTCTKSTTLIWYRSSNICIINIII